MFFHFIKNLLRAFDNRVLTIIFRPKKDKITEKWRKLSEESVTIYIFTFHIIFLSQLKEIDWHLENIRQARKN